MASFAPFDMEAQLLDSTGSRVSVEVYQLKAMKLSLNSESGSCITTGSVAKSKGEIPRLPGHRREAGRLFLLHRGFRSTCDLWEIWHLEGQ